MDIKIVSSLAKIFPDEICGGFEIDSISCLKNERNSFQIAVKSRSDCDIAVKALTLCDSVKIYYVKSVPASFTVFDKHDKYFLKKAKPGNYPDILMPLENAVHINKNEWNSFWVELDSENGLDKGNHEIKLSVSDGKSEKEVSITVEISDVALPEQKLICTHWFHTDCLASYYNVEVFSDEYWRITENFMREAVKHGTNFILTPLFTPPLDTEVGGERPTVQLVDVKRHGYKYTFGFDKLKKWVELAHKCGVKYFEMSHLYTQWGARHAPKIMAETTDGYKRIFGWETNAQSQGYSSFLRQLAPELIKFIDENGLHDYCMFHTSDEPDLKVYFPYKKSANLMKELFGDFKIIDALSEYKFLKNGIVENPVVNIEHIKKFYGKVPELWTYYCCGPCNNDNPNRFNAMPSLRNRILGFIMYKYGVKGFLHWGYNFYYTRYSKRLVDPFTETDAGGEFPSGDSYVVYPAPDGTPYDSLRLKVFYDAVKDYEALNLLEEKMSREDIISMLEEGLKKPLSERNYPHSEEWLISKRRQINRLLSE